MTRFGIKFLRELSNCDRLAMGKIIIMGKRLEVPEGLICSEIVTQVAGTYSIPLAQ